MRLLADENFPGDAVIALGEAGYDIVWVRKDAPGISDHDVLALARAQDRVLLTFDKDFGELVFRMWLPSPPGIILFRIPMSSPKYVARYTLKVITSRGDWDGHFSVVDGRRIRMTPLPRRDYLYS